ncbi:TolC family protein [Pendulispora brunnea]|uniref:TolC family protein n=1 Tax=Pendulispora brunnea TaxID=2905690 RepID=A0ABZ2KN87_9BACT
MSYPKLCAFFLVVLVACGFLGQRPAAAAPDARSPPPVVHLALADVIRLSVLRDPQIQVALANVKIAQGAYTTASLLPNPGFTVDRVFGALPGRPFSEQRPGGPTQYDFVVNYQIDTLLFGKRSAAMESARRAVEVATANHADVIRQRVLDAIGAYYDVLQTKMELDLARDAETQAQRLRDITRSRVALGSVGSIEADRTELAVLSANREQLRARAEVDKARARLRARVAWRPDEPDVDVVGDLEIIAPRPPPPLAIALERAERARPDFLASQRSVELASANLAAQRALAFPQLTIGTGLSYQQQIGVPDAPGWQIALSGTIPLFDRNQGNIAGARAGVQQAHEQLRADRLALRADVEQALREYQVSYDIVSKDDAPTLSAAAAARDKVQESYRLGGRTLLEVLDAQQAYRDAYRLSIEARAGYFKALHAINAAVGNQVLP